MKFFRHLVVQPFLSSVYVQSYAERVSLSRYGIVLKRLNTSTKFVHRERLRAHHSSFLRTKSRYRIRKMILSLAEV